MVAGMASVLIVEDDQDVVETVEWHLVKNGYQVARATSGLEALQRVARQRPDLVVLDLAIPDMDGFEVCGRLRADPATEFLPVLVLTASDTIESKCQAFDAGADDFVVKPFDVQELALRIKALVARRQSPFSALERLCK